MTFSGLRKRVGYADMTTRRTAWSVCEYYLQSFNNSIATYYIQSCPNLQHNTQNRVIKMTYSIPLDRLLANFEIYICIIFMQYAKTKSKIVPLGWNPMSLYRVQCHLVRPLDSWLCFHDRRAWPHAEPSERPTHSPHSHCIQKTIADLKNTIWGDHV